MWADSSKRQRGQRRRFLYLTLILVSLLSTAFPADGATITVNSAADAGGICPGPTCTLRQAILSAILGDTINFAGGITTINLTSSQLLISKNLNISGPGANLLTIQRTSGFFRIFEIDSGSTNTTISGLTITKGWVDRPNGLGASGGGILNSAASGTVSIVNCTISNNTADDVGVGSGGGIYNAGTVNIINTTISNNFSPQGGGIYNATGAWANITNCTISSNSIGNLGKGGGVNNAGTLHVTNGSISGNGSGKFGEGIGVWNNGTATFRNSIIAKNLDEDFNGALISEGFNLIGNNNHTTVTPTTGDQIGTPANPIDPLLGPLQNNGGPTFTRALLFGSPAIDKGSSPGITSDQRGRPRPFDISDIPNATGGDGSDIGAVEIFSPIQFSSPDASVGEGAGSVTLTVTRTGDVSQPATVHYATSDGTATSGSDYNSASGDLVFSSGQTSQTLSVQILDDATYEGDETFTVTLSSPVGTDLGRSSTVVRIVENDPAPRSLNISTRSRVQTGDNVMIGGFIITGNGPKTVVLRGLGPSLVKADIPAATVLNDPVLELHAASGALITLNDNWKESPQRAQIEGTVFQPSDDREAVIVATLPPAGYTVVLRGKDGDSGVGLVEAYDVDQSSDSVLGNLGTRALVGTGNDVLIGGFILGGANGRVTIIIRAIGPSLAQFGIANPLPNPTLELRDGNGALMTSNNDWKDNPDQQKQIMAAGLQPGNDLESALAVGLPPGHYTAVVAGRDAGSSGVGLVEVYNLR
jgi:hypothetical protein